MRSRRKPARRPFLALALLVLLASGLAACTTGRHTPPARTAAQRFLSALGARDVRGAAAATDDPDAAMASLTASIAGLGSTARASFSIDSVHSAKGRATVTYTAHWTLPGTRWSYRGSLPLVQSGKRWQVQWGAGDLHPKLTTGMHLALRLIQPQRAPLLDSAGSPLFVKTAVVRVGIEKRLVHNLDTLAATLVAIPELESTQREIVQAVQAAAPTDFVPVVTLRRPVYERIRNRIHNLPGTVFQNDTLLLTPTAHYAQPLLGTVGPATAQVVQLSHGRIAAGETTGLGGLQQAFDTTLAGTPGRTVVAEPDASGGIDTAIAVLNPPRPGRPVTLALDRATQSAAEQALAQVGKPAAIVAVQRSSGHILADANTPATTYDFGLAGAFPPGSTFKIATWTAAFQADRALTADSTVPCPATTTVDGRRFINENRFSHPPISVAASFGYSCNTSAISQILTLPASALAQAAHDLGLGAHWTLPVSAYSGSVPVPRTQTERAADAIGQGRVLASPLLMALMASAADGGRVLAPSLVPSARPTGPTLPRPITDKMHALMTATVQMPGGTGHALAGIGGVIGKTGTAEYGTAVPPRTHSWFAGVRGDVAFAVFVYDGATVGTDAVPIARDFLSGLR